MLVEFCLRLAVGMMTCLLVLSPVASARARRPVTYPGYFRTHFLITLAVACGALLWVRSTADTLVLVCLGVAVALAFAGSVTWSLERSPGGVILIVLTTLAVGTAWTLYERPTGGSLVGGLSSALLLGSALSAMLMGHSYLIAPSMSLVPLFRLLGVLAGALALRVLVDGYALGRWTAGHSLDNLTGDQVLWLPVRWLVGLAAPAVLCWMAWQTARIRSTQSATGILYVVVIFCFLGELVGQLLRPDGLTL